jgi:hypothetical protein
MLTLTIEEHLSAAAGYRLVARVPDTAPEALAGVAGTACWAPPADEGDEPTDTLLATEWAPDVDVAYQRAATRELIEDALADPADAPAAPEPVAEPGTEL